MASFELSTFVINVSQLFFSRRSKPNKQFSDKSTFVNNQSTVGKIAHEFGMTRPVRTEDRLPAGRRMSAHLARSVAHTPAINAGLQARPETLR